MISLLSLHLLLNFSIRSSAQAHRHRWVHVSLDQYNLRILLFYLHGVVPQWGSEVASAAAGRVALQPRFRCQLHRPLWHHRQPRRPGLLLCHVLLAVGPIDLAMHRASTAFLRAFPSRASHPLVVRSESKSKKPRLKIVSCVRGRVGLKSPGSGSLHMCHKWSLARSPIGVTCGTPSPPWVLTAE